MEMLGLLILILAGGVTFIAFLAALGLLVPDPIGKTRQVLTAMFGRSFLIGLVNFLFFFIVAALLVRFSGAVSGAIAIILLSFAVLILLALTIFTVVGLAGLVDLLGERMGGAKSPLAANLRGGLMLVLACLAPYVGWYILAPFVLLTGLGAAILALFQRKPAPVPEAER